MSNADNIRRYNERKRKAGFVRVDCLLTPKAYRVLRKHGSDWESYGETMSRLLESGQWNDVAQKHGIFLCE